MAKDHPDEDHETRPDAWQRFERAVDAAVKGGPKHRTSTEKRKSKATKKPKRKSK
jgi:hypothetical protein